MNPKPNFVLYEHKRQEYIEYLNLIFELFTDRISPSFDSILYEAEEVEKQKYLEYTSNLQYDDADKAIEASEIAYFLGLEKYKKLSLMKYHALAISIMLLSHTWEQEVTYFIIEELAHNQFTNLKFEYSDKGLIGFFSQFNIDITKNSFWPEILEMRLVVNVLKHAEGHSAAELRKIRPDLFDLALGIDALSLYGSSLLATTLDLSINDFEKYHDAVCDFWKTLPEKFYL